VAREGDKIRQEPEAEQDRREDVGEECGAPRGKCIVKGRFWRGVIWGKRRANNLVGRSSAYRGK